MAFSALPALEIVVPDLPVSPECIRTFEEKYCVKDVLERMKKDNYNREEIYQDRLSIFRDVIKQRIDRAKSTPVYIPVMEFKASYRMAKDVSEELQKLGWKVEVTFEKNPNSEIFYVDYLILEQ